MASNGSSSATVRAPIIGVTTYMEPATCGVWNVDASFLHKVYIDAITDAGGIAVAIPPQPISPEKANSVIAALDGIVFAGGADIDPARYAQPRHERTGVPRVDRDELEFRLLSSAISAQLPFLGICRGAQLLNVALGGTLTQHLPDIIGDQRYQLSPGVFNPISLEVENGTRIAQILGSSRRVTAHLYHHQAIDTVADGLAVTSTTEDGIVQSVELESQQFGLAVQWHPEQDVSDRRLFVGLVNAAIDSRDGNPPLQQREKDRT